MGKFANGVAENIRKGILPSRKALFEEPNDIAVRKVQEEGLEESERICREISEVADRMSLEAERKPIRLTIICGKNAFSRVSILIHDWQCAENGYSPSRKSAWDPLDRHGTSLLLLPADSLSMRVEDHSKVMEEMAKLSNMFDGDRSAFRKEYEEYRANMAERIFLIGEFDRRHLISEISVFNKE
jgi:hypothetical protein